jgi:hypothetical protein
LIVIVECEKRLGGAWREVKRTRERIFGWWTL